jgi:Zn-dependent oligopeptidase
MEHKIKKMSSITTDNGLAVFIQSQLTDTLPVMIGSQPIIESKFKVEELLDYIQAMEVAIETMKNEAEETKHPATIVNAINSMEWLQHRFERMADDANAMHKAIVSHMAQEKPELMQGYLSAFSKAVGQGEV